MIDCRGGLGEGVWHECSGGNRGEGGGQSL